MNAVAARNILWNPLLLSMIGFAAVCLAIPSSGAAQEKADYQFAGVDDLPIQKGMPDPFLKPDGKRVTTPEEWPAQREYLRAILQEYMWGHIPPRPDQKWGVVHLSRATGQERCFGLPGLVI